MGGRAQTARRLDAFFAYDALRKNPYEAVRKDWVMGPYNYYSQYRYNPNNEPDLHAPWMYTLVGQPWKTSTVLRAAETLFTNAPNGVTGNDDLGTMSAWYVFSVLGLYPSMPGSGHFLLHAPKFASAEIDVGNGKTLRINSNAASGKAPMAIEQVRWNGQPRPQVWLDWEQLNTGGQIQMKLGSDAAVQTWGTQTDALPADLREPQRP